MDSSTKKSPIIIHFSADVWEHVCPVLRVTGPATEAGWRHVRGNEWEGYDLKTYPERIKDADMVLVQRDFPRHAAAYDAALTTARKLGKPVVYDLDDLLTELPEDHPGYPAYRGARAPMLAAMVEADTVICSTSGIAEYVQDYNPNTIVLPNYLNDQLWKLRQLEESGKPTTDQPVILGYLGSPSHAPDLAIIQPILTRLLDRFGTQLILRLWGIKPPPELATRANVEWWDLGLVSYQAFAAYFSRQECDAFIAPLQDNLFNRCKSSLKFLEYSALGIPGVYTRIQPYEVVVNHGENGFLAATPEEWEASLVQLLEDPALRKRLGAAAQATVKSDWLLADHRTSWAEAMEPLLEISQAMPSRQAERRLARKFRRWHQDDLADQAVLQAEVAKKQTAVDELQIKLGEKELLAQNYLEQLTAIRNSTGWKLLEAVYAIRLAFIPQQSRRERVLHVGLHSLRILKNEGLRTLASKGLALVKTGDSDTFLGLTTAASQPAAQIQVGQPAPSPAISVVVVQDPVLPALNMEQVQDWIASQTLHAITLVHWDRTGGIASVPGAPEKAWEARGVRALCDGLPGPYLCLASQDLLTQAPSYLEKNLMALESEHLIFTLNTRGATGWSTRLLAKGRLPGNRLQPLLRMVIHKRFITEDFAVDLPARVKSMEGNTSLVGKVIQITTADPEVGASFPMETTFGEVEATLQGSNILARTPSENPWTPTPIILSTVDSVLPPVPEPDPRPTVILVMPFLAVGGAEQLHLHVLRELQNAIRFVVLAVDPLDPSLGTLTEAFEKITPWVYNLADFLHPDLRLSFLHQLINRFEPVGLYIANGAIWIYDVLPALKLRYPALRTSNQVYDSKIGWINRYDASLVASLDAHIGANQRICQAYLEMGALPEQIFQVAHPIDPSNLDPEQYHADRIAAVKAKLGLPQDTRVVTFASRLHPQKRPMDFIELARRLATEPTISFLLIGDGPLAQVVSEQISKSGLDNVFQHPFYRPISDILAITDTLVLPSEYEGMPLIIGETQVMGKPVVVTDVGNNREVLEITEGGMVIPRIGDIHALMQGVQEMLANPPDPAGVRERFLAEYGSAKIAQKYKDVLLGKTNA